MKSRKLFATAAVAAALLKAVNDVAFVPGDTVSLMPVTEETIVVRRRVGPAEVGRLRRQFVRVHEAIADKMDNPAEAFVKFLRTALC